MSAENLKNTIALRTKEVRRLVQSGYDMLGEVKDEAPPSHRIEIATGRLRLAVQNLDELNGLLHAKYLLEKP